MPSYLNCGAHVTEQFARVLGDNEDDVHACPECTTQTDIYRGAAAHEDFEARVQAGHPTRTGGDT
ncbi:hypothetical protein G9464_17235 [Halostella sp. JP-L12]|uniref:DUF7563 family protein n=1 Tax=Halostella sp. JP-L12 TaxID=2716716 RepID=UPI000EF7B4F7|nr:hypothetical protein [Halostella sp. JP-L12]NHN49318.1 hypothetical protein [Halostella sp. JP-L12]